MIAPFANLFGYILNFIYNIVNNYGLAIIIFSILIKIILLPLSIKQQKTMKKTTKIQNKLKEIQFKYKNDPENLNRATMELYKTENMSPFSGCFSGIVQIILLFAVFYLVRSPLTYMKKIDANIINKYTKIVKENDLSTDSAYPEIEVIRELNNIKKLKENNTENIENNSENNEEKTDLAEINDEELNSLDINMNLMFPVMYLAVALIAPLGLALYWLMNSLLMIIERLALNKMLKDEEE